MGREAYTAEFIGTFALVFFGSVSLTVFGVILGGAPSSSFLAIAFVPGIILMAMVYAIGNISGCHINPAITITAVALRKMDWDDGAAYIVAQIVAATLAGWAHKLILQGPGEPIDYGTLGLGQAIGQSPVVGVVVELIITFFLMFAVYAVLYTGKVPAGASGVLIGMTLTADILIAGPLTGGAANPARAIGPAVASGVYQNLWVYLVGPIIGALLAGFVYEYLLTARQKK